MSSTSTLTLVLSALRYIAVLPAAIAVYFGYLLLMWLLTLMISSLLGDFFIPFLIATSLIVLIGNIASANMAIKMGAFIAPANRVHVAAILCGLYVLVTFIGIIVFWNVGLGSNEQPGMTYFIGGKDGLWRWWLLLCALMSIVGAVRAVFRISWYERAA